MVIFTTKPRQYLLLHYPSRHWDFPKGHLEKGETNMDAARREVREETGLSKVEVLPGFTHAFDYEYRRSDRTRVHKTVTFFLARASTHKVRISHEHRDFAWLPYEQAVDRVTYENARNLLHDAERFLLRLGAEAGSKPSHA